MNNECALGFAPHGAGRNFSRSEYGRRFAGTMTAEELIARDTAGIDCRYHSGVPDLSELPSAYKSAPDIIRQIQAFGLAEIVDYVDPYGCIMAGHWQAAWKRKKKAENV